MANPLFATRESDSLWSENPGMSQPSRGLVLAAFRDTDDGRLAGIETRLSADVLTEEKLARIDAALDETKRRLDRLSLDAQRPALGGSTKARDPLAHEHK